jgi:hypothetical protein
MQRFKRAIFGSLGLAPLLFGLAQTASAQPIDTVLNLNFQNLDLSSPVLLSGTALQPNAVYFYDNVATVGADVIDARIELIAENNCSITIFDSNADNPARFEPSIDTAGGGGGGYGEFRIRFYVGANRVALQNFYATGVDIDGTDPAGGNDNREFHEIGDFDDYQVSTTPRAISLRLLGPLTS